ncbi:MAG: 50S ribosomal protein L15 [Patescibacteria group bacterium]
MQLHQLQPIHNLKNKKRIARGGKRGTYSGRGQKGQKSRAGAKIRPAEQDLIIRIPKRRGFKNKPLGLKPLIINIGELEKQFENKQVINKKVLQEKGFIKTLGQRVKILSGGELKKALEIEGLEVSKKAEEKIKAAGGKIIRI